MEAQGDSKGSCDRKEHQGFGDVKNFIASLLTIDKKILLATSYNFLPNEMDKIRDSNSDSVLFVDYLVEKGHISETPQGLKDFLRKLQDNDLGGIADQIQRYLQSQKKLLYLIEDTNDEGSGTAGDMSLQGNDATNPPVERTLVYEECSLYIVELWRIVPTLTWRDKALCIGIVLDLTSKSSPEPKLLYVTYVSGNFHSLDGIFQYFLKSGRKISQGNFYKLQYCNRVGLDASKRGILISPHTRCSLISRRVSKTIDFDQLQGEFDFHGMRKAALQMIFLPWYTVARAKYDLPKGSTVFNLKAVLKEVDIRRTIPSRRVLTVIDNDNGDSLSVVILSEHTSMANGLFENNSLVLKYFKVAGEGDTNYLISTDESDIEALEDESLKHLKQLDDSKEGYINQVDDVEFYLTCHNCFDTKLDEALTCPSCKYLFDKSQAESYFCVKLWIDLNDVGENSNEETLINGLVFKCEMLRAIAGIGQRVMLPKGEEERQVVNELCELLIDKKVRVIIKPKGDEPNNIFRRLIILQD